MRKSTQQIQTKNIWSKTGQVKDVQYLNSRIASSCCSPPRPPIFYNYCFALFLLFYFSNERGAVVSNRNNEHFD